MKLVRKNNGELSQSERNVKYVERHPIVQQGIAGFGSNSYHYTDHEVDGFIVRSSRCHGLDILGNAQEVKEGMRLAAV